jgi:hypothetical protein
LIAFRQVHPSPDASTSGRADDDLHVHPVALVLARVVGPVPAGDHGDPVDAHQSAVEDHERLAPGHVDGLLERRGQVGDDVEGLADVAENGGADAEPDRQVGVGLTLAQMSDDQQRLLPCWEASPAGSSLGATSRRASDSMISARLDMVMPAG